ncbi:hypothetical protein GCM10027515_21160 [Schumannella luteola]|uniref:Lipoprotein n=1 Tax=Schumannella luteola TaxID=472059 RepID=A0A852YLL2_9MICO|nr:hypothetical protein [Schumannella luteola]NYH00089.1 hypothetical protein [Schumannella luteola]TPX06642.1 hypothetical protein FJ656_00390 [Schumannella luteola]
MSASRVRRPHAAPGIRRAVAAVVIAGIAAVLSGCSSDPAAVAFGRAQPVHVADARTKTDATVTVTVTGVDAAPAGALDGVDLDDEERTLTPYFVQYRAKLADGDYSDDFQTPFYDAWSGSDATGATLAPLSVFGSLRSCPAFGADEATALAKGDEVAACQILLGEKGGVRELTLLEHWRWTPPAKKG